MTKVEKSWEKVLFFRLKLGLTSNLDWTINAFYIFTRPQKAKKMMSFAYEECHVSNTQ